MKCIKCNGDLYYAERTKRNLCKKCLVVPYLCKCKKEGNE